MMMISRQHSAIRSQLEECSREWFLRFAVFTVVVVVHVADRDP